MRKPPKEERGPDGRIIKQKKRFMSSSSSDSESEEDFAFLETALRRREFDEIEQRLL